MAVTPEIEAEIIKAFEMNPKRFSPFKTSKRVGATLEEVLSVVTKHKGANVAYDGRLRRPELERFILASRRVSEPAWDNEDAGIVMARRLFEAGTHDMATHRDNGWFHLLCIPLNRPRRARPGYFTGKPIR
jgi:hypothetical protein